MRPAYFIAIGRGGILAAVLYLVTAPIQSMNAFFGRPAHFTLPPSRTDGLESFTATGLPAGLAIEPDTGIISGRPSESGTFWIEISARRPSGAVERFAHSLTVGTVYRWTPGSNWMKIEPGHDFISIGGDSAVTDSGTVVSDIYWGRREGDFIAASDGLALRADGTVLEASNRHERGPIDALSKVVAVSSSSKDSLNAINLVLRSDGTLYSWSGAQVLPTPPGLSNVVAIATGFEEDLAEGLALTADRRVVRWRAPLEPGSASPRGEFILGATNIVAVSANLLLTDDGTIWAKEGSIWRHHPNMTNIVAVGSLLALRADGSVEAFDGDPPIALSNVVDVAVGGLNSVLLSSPPELAKPLIVGARRLTAGAGHPFTYRVRVANSPAELEISGLPPGLSFDSSTGIISGTPLEPGASALTVSAKNVSAETVTEIILTVIPPAAPVIPPMPVVQALPKNQFTYHPYILNAPEHIWAGGLPPGLDIDPQTGVITGVTSAFGDFNVVLTASNQVGTATSEFTLRVSPVWEASPFHPARVSPPGLSNIVSISASTSPSASIVLSSDGSVVAWHTSSFSEPDMSDEPSIIGYPELSNIVAIAGAMALRKDGAVFRDGQPFPDPPGPAGIITLADGGTFALFLREDDTVDAWDHRNSVWLPNWQELTNVVNIAAGDSIHYAATQSGLYVEAWPWHLKTFQPNFADLRALSPNPSWPVGAFVAGNGDVYFQGLSRIHNEIRGANAVRAIPVPHSEYFVLKANGQLFFHDLELPSLKLIAEHVVDIVSTTSGGSVLVLFEQDTIERVRLTSVALETGWVHLQVRGAHGFPAQIQRAASIEGPWSVAKALTLTGSEVDVSLPISGGRTEFYRIVRR